MVWHNIWCIKMGGYGLPNAPVYQQYKYHSAMILAEAAKPKPRKPTSITEVIVICIRLL